jgi:hypothetical protein
VGDDDPPAARHELDNRPGGLVGVCQLLVNRAPLTGTDERISSNGDQSELSHGGYFMS